MGWLKRKKKSKTMDVPPILDRMDYHYDSTLEAYLIKHRKKLEELNREDEETIMRYASAHLGFFIKWMLIKHYENEEEFDGDEMSIALVRQGTLSGTDFLLDVCDGKLLSCMIADDWIQDLYDYYEHSYLEDYTSWMDLQGYELYSFQEIREAYDSFAAYIEDGYVLHQKYR